MTALLVGALIIVGVLLLVSLVAEAVVGSDIPGKGRP